MIDSKVIDAFHMMWGNFPAPARLIHKSRKVLALNEIAKGTGMEVGVPCFEFGNPESHKSCNANGALSSGKGQRMNVEQGSKIKFWSPVEGCPDVFVHFSILVDPVK
jgi:hypothetical protein